MYDIFKQNEHKNKLFGFYPLLLLSFDWSFMQWRFYRKKYQSNRENTPFILFCFLFASGADKLGRGQVFLSQNLVF